MATGDEVGGTTMTEFVPIKDLEAEFNSVATKFRNELQKAHERCSTQQDEIIKLKKELKQAEQRHSREQHYLQNMNEENKSHIERLNEHIKSMNIKIKELNSEHSKETEQLKFELNEVNHSLTSKINEEKIRTTEMEYKMCTLKEESVKYSETEKNLNAEVARLTSEKEQLHSCLTKEIDVHALYKQTAEQTIQILMDDVQSVKDEKDAFKNRCTTLSVKLAQNESDLSRKVEELKNVKSSLNGENKSLRGQIKKMEATHETEIKQLRDSRKNELRQWEMSNKKYISNPNIADFSDEKRPTKLAEEFCDLYDMEWTDAYDAYDMVDISDEKMIIAFMLELLQRAYEICTHCMQEVSNAIGRTSCTFTIPSRTLAVQNVMKLSEENYDEVPGRLSFVQNVMKTLRENVPGRLKSKSSEEIESTDESSEGRHQDAEQERTFECSMEPKEIEAVHDIKKRFASKVSGYIEKIGTEIILSEQEVDDPCKQSVAAYVQKCLNVCWSMCMPVPSVHVDFPVVTEDMIFDSNKYKPYTKIGKYVEYIVWPALYLHEGGPLLCKGVAQGGDKNII